MNRGVVWINWNTFSIYRTMSRFLRSLKSYFDRARINCVVFTRNTQHSSKHLSSEHTSKTNFTVTSSLVGEGLITKLHIAGIMINESTHPNNFKWYLRSLIWLEDGRHCAEEINFFHSEKFSSLYLFVSASEDNCKCPMADELLGIVFEISHRLHG